MKKCPKCQAEYFDEMLEFCLEDGVKLTVVKSATTTADTKILDTAQNSIETAFFRGGSETPKILETQKAGNTNSLLADETKLTSLKQIAVEKGYRTLEIGTLILALAHNWLQWLYIDRQSYGSLSNFLFSAEFLIWLFLLSAGAVAGFLTIKFSRNKALGYAGLVILAINFLLLIVPRK